MMAKLILIFLSLTIFFVISDCYIVDPGPVVKATKGEIWPKAKYQIQHQQYSVIQPMLMKFKAINHSCDILEQAIARYLRIIMMTNLSTRRHMRTNSKKRAGKSFRRYKRDRTWRNDPLFDNILEVVDIDLKSPCEKYPYLGMDESYNFTLSEANATITSNSIWGILRGMESFSQMVIVADDISLRINSTEIMDEPRFSHRGLLLDTSRHFINLFTIYKILDGMVFNKLNVFHWHIVDDHSFPYESLKYPELNVKGAYHPTFMIYSQNDVHTIIEYARVRGIRVMSEFDTPGHTRSWGVSHPEILTECGEPYEGKLGPMDPTKEVTYEFMENILEEIVEVFPEQYIHLGGDEVDFECWSSNKIIRQYMKDNNLTTYEMLEEKYIQRVVSMVDKLNASSMVWQEVFVNGVKLPNETVVHVWTGNRQALLADVTYNGLPALLSACWYLDHLVTGGDWRNFYNCDPHDFPGTEKQKKLVMGGEACMWSESVDNSNVLQRIFPRVSAVAEKLWSQQDVQDIDEASRRLEEHTCRMKNRGIPAQPPNGPGFCY